MGQSGCAPALSLPYTLPPSFSLSRSLPPRITFPLLSSSPMPGVALAPGQLHNSWPCYTDRRRRLPNGDPLLEGRRQPFSPSLPPPSPGFPGSTLVGRVMSTSHTPVCSPRTAERVRVRSLQRWKEEGGRRHTVCPDKVGVLKAFYVHRKHLTKRRGGGGGAECRRIFRLSYERRHPPSRRPNERNATGASTALDPP